MIAGLILALSRAVLGIAGLLVQTVVGLRNAMAVDPYVFAIDGSSTPHPTGIAAAGPNDDKVLWIFMTTAGMLDQYVNANPAIGILVNVALAAVVFMVLVWTLNHWRDLLSF